MSQAIRKVVIDTNVILFDPLAVNKFDKAHVYIPISVIEEVDRFKKDLGENGRNARQFSRFIDFLRSKGSLSEGIPLDSRGESRVFVIADQKDDSAPLSLHENKTDNRILMIALFLKKQDSSHQVELITKDINLRIKADVFGIDVRDYEPEKVSFEEMYTGYRQINLDSSLIDRFYKERVLKLSGHGNFFPNQYIIAKDSSNENHSALGRYDQKQKAMLPLINLDEGVWGIHPRNMEQSFALDSLS